MSSPVSVVIEEAKCSGCGQCLRVCPDQTLSLQSGKAVVSGSECIRCGHCVAVCPEAAVHVPEISVKADFSTFTAKEEWIPWGEYDTASLVQLMGSRRSCRNYASRCVEREVLHDLVKVAITAPSGTNSQGWTFTVLSSRSEVVFLGDLVAGFYKQLNRKAQNPILRFLARLFMGDALGRYFRRYYHSIARGLKEWEEKGIDRLFHNAPAVILVGSRPEASCPGEDAMLASQNILLAAHAMGLGTCLIGFAVEAMKRDKSIGRSLGIPDDETTYAVIALGYPTEKYQRVAGRKPVTLRMAMPQ